MEENVEMLRVDCYVILIGNLEYEKLGKEVWKASRCGVTEEWTEWMHE